MWVFRYGSLIWKAGFPYDERVVGFIKDYRRVFYQGSTDHRGTPEFPGRTVTLEPTKGEVCWGAAYKIVNKEDQLTALEYLEDREKADSGAELRRYGGEREAVAGGGENPLPRRRTYLRNRVKILEEKEKNLELRLLEYYGIKEQETAVIELQNRLRLNTMEAKLYNLKIESLLLDNRRLEAQAADHANASAELEAAKGKIKMLRKKLKSDAD